jgi:hypothetical protein
MLARHVVFRIDMKKPLARLVRLDRSGLLFPCRCFLQRQKECSPDVQGVSTDDA